jgi:predicted N-acyltransferase
MPRKSPAPSVTGRLVNSLKEVSRDDWQALAGKNPFMSYDFLELLEASGCASPKTGWMPLYLLLEEDGELIGAAAAYLKSHSRGEYVFDQGWAEAFERNGLSYYPKLLVSVPFTPVTGPRLLAKSDEARALVARALVSVAVEQKLSSLHILFVEEQDRLALEEAGFMMREAVQFHWTNDSYWTFDVFLASLSHDKRKKLKQDRKSVAKAGITFRWLTGADLTQDHLKFFYACYVHTYKEHWSSPYLTLAFFLELHERRPDMMMLVLAERDGEPVACALNVIGDSTLYGRYWGTTEFVSGLHFETCYMQSIEFCIARGVQRFEGGAQGEHKMARGLMPVRTHSAHWVADRRFAEAIEDFLGQETKAIEGYVEQLEGSSPFKTPS